MIIVRLIGGLGNQMFQYALGRQLALSRQDQLLLDVSGFETYKLFNYELDKLNIIARLASAQQVAEFSRYHTLPYRIARNIAPRFFNTHYVHERQFSFDPQILRLSPPLYLDGYWQSERYFKKYSAQIRSELSVKHRPNAQNRSLLDTIARHQQSVALHIRRGDYVANKATNSKHGTCSLDYYQRGIKWIARKVKDPCFFIFSDDPVWVQKNLKMSHPAVYVANNGGDKPCEDMRLMSHCRHFIIANSSFSWWGAWLSDNSDKIVISPRRWFNDQTRNTKDLYPKGWVKL